ncbi:Gfo/Idh/MocA family oxidoreductase [Infirmifilum lucidum]|uniref:Gfo/Idh/MocA family oxidoreductase n=1 Tax=Infirmifilum lucidum TaxID=2776706 RepID=A0A7L9FK32_9CREN|nr:Gfo/Idh/MocA family oxidoreductase [Infirmifilum lucidum]QOJ79236.1 Gfo/Idh/MocA family oxidoreductase [Infirmifilum lucidum]
MGLIGSGWSANAQAWALRALRFTVREDGFPEVELVRAMSSTPSKIESFARQFGFKEWTTKEGDFFKGDLDVVIIASPNNTHAYYASRAIESGADIIVEKPFTVTVEEAREIVSKAKKSRRRGAICLVSRLLPASVVTRELISRGEIGEIREFRAVIAHAKHAYADTPFEWRMSREVAGGGVFADLGVHPLDLSENLTGLKVKRIWGRTYTLVSERFDPRVGQKVKVDTEDVGFAVLEFENGGVGSIEASKVSPGFEEQMRIEIHGDKGGIRFSITEPQTIYIFKRGTSRVEKVTRGFEDIYPWLIWPAPKSFEGWVYAYLILHKNFIDNVSGLRESTVPTLEDGLRSQVLLSSFYESSTKGEPIDLE